MKRNFCVGSEWLYYKIYTGVQITDTILIEKLHPIIENLKSENKIEKWFFIRYKDTDDHFRLRFYSPRPEELLQVIRILAPVFEELMQQDIIWKVQLDTYQREIERYGHTTIEDSESLFYFDSEMILKYLALKPYFIEENTALLFSFLSIDRFLNCFALSTEQKLELLDKLQRSFKNEFKADKVLKKEFDKSFRTLSNDITAFINLDMEEDFSELYQIISDRDKALSNFALSIQNNLPISLYSFLSSHIHMMINRQFTSRQRQYECLIYDHLHRYYKRKYHAAISL